MKGQLIKNQETVSGGNMAESAIEALKTSKSPHVLVEDITQPNLSEEKHHHLRKVLRIKPNSLLTATDGNGSWGAFTYTGEVLVPVDGVRSDERPSPSITIAISLTKVGKPDIAIQKLTEIGVDEVILFSAENSIPLWDFSKRSKNEQRLRRISQSALEQSKGVWLPKLTFANSFADVAEIPNMSIADVRGDPLIENCRCLAVGPEGGWSPDEYSFGLPRVSLGHNILRAETAAIVAGSLMTSLRNSGRTL